MAFSLTWVAFDGGLESETEVVAQFPLFILLLFCQEAEDEVFQQNSPESVSLEKRNVLLKLLKHELQSWQ